jgi:hypothetical protein
MEFSMGWTDEERDVRRHTANQNSWIEGLGVRAGSILYWAAQTDDPITPAFVRGRWQTKDILISDLIRERYCGPIIAIEISKWADYQ